MKKQKEGKFVRVKCPKCKSSQVIFGKTATEIRCIKCNNKISKTSGGKTKIRGMVEKVFHI
jgi:ribosomal protein S27E